MRIENIEWYEGLITKEKEYMIMTEAITFTEKVEEMLVNQDTILSQRNQFLINQVSAKFASESNITTEKYLRAILCEIKASGFEDKYYAELANLTKKELSKFR